MLGLETDIVNKMLKKKKEFDKEYASGNYIGAVSIFDRTQEAADFLEITDDDIKEMFSLGQDNKNKRLGIFDTHKVMDAKAKILGKCH